MRKTLYSLAIASLLVSFNSHAEKVAPSAAFDVNINLVKVKNDQVSVTMLTPTFSTSTATFHIPKTVPGTYSEDNYGRYIESFKAFDASGATLTVSKKDENTFVIEGATKLNKVTYLVNDSYDTEIGEGFGKKDIFSPAGTNIYAGKNFMLNTHGFIGYFKDYEQSPYKLTVTHPKGLEGVSAMTDANPSKTVDVFEMPSYANLVEMPLMYSKPNYASFMVDDMEIIISLYSPSGKYKVSQIAPGLEKMMKAQKHFLGSINATKKYAVLIYLADDKIKDAKGTGALEHPTSTTVVLPESMELEAMEEILKDVVSHEFFHIVTPLTVHSEQIHYFDFNEPEMSEHLWMYEGVTEYFANLFQVTEGLIDENAFYKRMSEKIANSMQMNDSMSFTVMSKNVFETYYKDQYLNVYEKGALIAMCIDMIIREKSNGQKGILNLMHDLSNEYGSKRPFKDDELFAKITELTYPEVGAFLDKYVAGDTRIPYEEFFGRMGVTKTMIMADGNPFLKGLMSGGEMMPYISVDPSTKDIFWLPEGNAFTKSMGIQDGDIIVEINGNKYNYDNINSLIEASISWKDGNNMTMKVKRDGKVVTLTGVVALPKEEAEGYAASDDSKKTIREAWLKGK
ncbi:MAG: peptidase M61 [Bacteroidota bacterium]